MIKDLYTYKAKVIDVYDGDTITCEVDCGFNIKHTIKVRLAQIDTPEIRGEERQEGLKVRDIVREIILNKEIYLQTAKDKTGKYGRYLGTVYVYHEDAPQVLLEGQTSKFFINYIDLNNNYAKVYGS